MPGPGRGVLIGGVVVAVIAAGVVYTLHERASKNAHKARAFEAANATNDHSQLCKLGGAKMCDECAKAVCRTADCEPEFFTFAPGNVTQLLEDIQPLVKAFGSNINLLKNFETSVENSKQAVKTALFTEMMTTQVNIGSKYGGKLSPVNAIRLDYQAVSEGNVSYRLSSIVGMFCPGVCTVDYGTFNIVPQVVKDTAAPSTIQVRAELRMKTCPKVFGTVYTHFGVGTSTAAGDIELVLLLAGTVTFTLGSDSGGYIEIRSVRFDDLTKQYVSTKTVGHELNALRSLASFFTGKDSNAMIEDPVNHAIKSALPRIERAVNKLGRKAVSGTSVGLQWYLPETVMKVPAVRKYFNACHGPTPWGGLRPGQEYSLKDSSGQCTRPTTALTTYKVPVCKGVVCGKQGPCGTCTQCPECTCLMSCQFGGRCVPV